VNRITSALPTSTPSPIDTNATIAWTKWSSPAARSEPTNGHGQDQVAADHPERAEAMRQRLDLVAPAQAVLGATAPRSASSCSAAIAAGGGCCSADPLHPLWVMPGDPARPHAFRDVGLREVVG
jgi:hypothetical protein